MKTLIPFVLVLLVGCGSGLSDGYTSADSPTTSNDTSATDAANAQAIQQGIDTANQANAAAAQQAADNAQQAAAQQQAIQTMIQNQ